jgi:hypothetical protein
MTEMTELPNRRKITVSQKIAWWMNLIVLVVAGLPMAIVPLKEHLPEHFYGVIGPSCALITFLILTYQNHRKSSPYPGDEDDVEAKEP